MKDGQKSPDQSKAEFLSLVLQSGNPELLMDTLADFQIKGMAANKQKALFLEKKAEELETLGQTEDAKHTRNIATKIRGLGNKEIDLHTVVSFLE